MAPSVRPFGACLRCVRQSASTNAALNGTPRRFLTSTLAPRDELQKQPAVNPPPPPPPTAASPPVDAAASEGAASKEVPEFMKNWGPLDPEKVEWKRQERRLIRRDGVQPVGSRRRRAVLYRSSVQNTADVPFEQLPYQCFQEARKILLQDRQDKLKEIETQTLRISNLEAQDPSVSGGVQAKETRLRSMRNHLDQLILLADINDPMVKRRFEDGLGDMNKPIYRYLAEQKWRKHKRLVLQQRISQMNIVPDILPALDPVADVDLAFSRKAISPGEFVDSAISEKMPRLTVQVFEPGEKLVTVVVVDADVPVPEEDRFTYRCHFIASNIPLSPTNTSIPLQRIEHEDKKVGEPAGKKIALPWAAPWAHKGAPYHRMAIFVLEQKDAKALDTAKLGQTERDGFILRSFIDKHKLKPIGFSMFRTKWDDSMASVMERAGLAEEAKIEFKRKRVEPLPHKRRTERMR